MISQTIPIALLAGSSPPPAAPADLAVVGGNAQAAFTWTAVSGASTYNLYRGTTPSGESATPVATGLTGTSYTNTGLTNGTNYYWYLTALGPTGSESVASNEVNVATLFVANFTAADNTTLTAYTPDYGAQRFVALSGSSTLKVSGNKAVGATSGTFGGNLIDWAVSDWSLTFDLGYAGSDTHVTLFPRYVDANNYWEFQWHTGTWAIFQTVAGSAVAGATGTLPTFATGNTYAMKIVCDGSRIELWQGGVLVVSTTDSTFSTATKFAWWTFKASAVPGTTLDNFLLTNAKSTPPTAPPYATGLLAHYAFDESWGASVHNYHGTFPDATFGATTHAPGWALRGLSLSGGASPNNKYVQIADSGATLLAQINTVMVMIAPSAGSANAFLGSDNASGIFWNSASSYPADTAFPAPSVNGVAAGLTASLDPLYSPDVATIVSDSVADKVYMGTAETTRYSSGPNATSGAGRVGNNIQIGSAAGWLSGHAGFGGTIQELLLFSTKLNASQIAQNVAWMRANATRRGGTFPYQNAGTGRQLVANGDSITVGFPSNTPWVDLMTLSPSCTKYNFAINGQPLNDIVQGGVGIVSSSPTRVFPLLSAPNASLVIYVIMACTNDLSSGQGYTPAQCIAAYQVEVAGALAKGSNVRVVILPVIDIINDVSHFSPATRATFNGLLMSTFGAMANVTVFDTSLVPELYVDGASANTTYYNSVDHIHPTQAGQQKLADALGPVINALT